MNKLQKKHFCKQERFGGKERWFASLWAHAMISPIMQSAVTSNVLIFPNRVSQRGEEKRGDGTRGEEKRRGEKERAEAGCVLRVGK